MASLTRWTWVWASSRRWWQIGKPGMLKSMGSQRVGHEWATELNWTQLGAHWGFHTNLTLPVQTPQTLPCLRAVERWLQRVRQRRRIGPRNHCAPPDELRGVGDGNRWMWPHKGETRNCSPSWQRPYPCLQGSLERKKKNAGWIRSAEQTPVYRNMSFSPGKVPQDKQPGSTETL